MQTISLHDGEASFEVSVCGATNSSTIVLFSVGAGGKPERYSTLLNTFAKSGCMVIAPHFERLTGPMAGKEDLTLRARRLSIALDTFTRPNTTLVGVGHSIGAATLLAMSGAQMWLVSRQRVNITPDSRLTRLALLATPTNFFKAPEALDALRTPLLIWIGSEDHITPPAQSQWLVEMMLERQSVDYRITDGAGHFSFMDQIPPNITDPLQNKQEFLLNYSREVSKFLLGSDGDIALINSI